MKHIIGIDVGKAGAICIMTDIVSLQEMPDSAYGIAEELRRWPTAHTHVFVEKAQCFAKNGAVGMFNYGKGYGEILGVIAALGLSHSLVPPSTWTKVMHKGAYGKDAKGKSLDAARRLFPHVDLMRTMKCKVPDSGFIDALLIAEYGRRVMGW